MRLTTFCAAFLSLSVFLLMSCSSIPNPFEEGEPWDHAIRQAKRAAQLEAAHVVQAQKMQRDRISDVTFGNDPALDPAFTNPGSEEAMSKAIGWYKEKMRWLAEARRKGFTGDDSEVEPQWYTKWKKEKANKD